ncbi:MAG: phage baseplate assembly protein V [Actinomycetota bacterium]|nr:phage baseplate assembly protein V [Actinomycetota bacterium]
MVDHPAAAGPEASLAASEIATALAARIGGSFAEAYGDAQGDPRIAPGNSVEISGVDETFNGTWTISSARHIFDSDEGGYRTHFEAHCGTDRSLLGLTGGDKPSTMPRLRSVVCGVVTNNDDPDRNGRVKLALPWLSPDFETDWAPVTQVGASAAAGALFLPSVGDQVLVGFEFGDPRRPYVIGSVLTGESRYDLGGPAVKASGGSAQVVRQGMRTPSGNRLVFVDDMPPTPGAPASESQMLIGSDDGQVAIALDQVRGTVSLVCRPSPPRSNTTAGAITIECGPTGSINIRAGQAGRVTVDGGEELTLTATAKVKINTAGVVEIKGEAIQLN